MSEEKNNTPETTGEETYEGILGDFEETEAAEEAAEESDGETFGEKSEAKKKSGSKKVLKIAGICAAVLAVGGLGSFGVLKLRESMPKTVASSDHAKITDRMASCYLKDVVNMYVSYYGEDGLLSYYGLDVNQSLKDQPYPMDETQTWFDYMIGSVQNNLTQYLVFKEAGQEMGYKLSDAEQQTIEDKLAEADLTKYPEGITEKDLRAAFELQAFGAGVYADVYNGFTFTDDEIETYFDANSSQYTTCGLMGFSVSYQTEDAAGEESTADETGAEEESGGMDQETAKKLATDLKNVKSAEQFESKVADILTEYEGYTDEELESLLPTISNDSFGYIEGNEMAEWAFGDDAKVGDTLMIEGDGVYYIYLMTREPGRDESQTINVRHILFNVEDHLSVDAASATDEDKTAALEECRKLAQAALDEWQNGDATEDSFAEMAGKLSEDPGSNTNGGLYSNVGEGEMVATFNDWCFDASRQTGDYGIVETDYGVHVMFFSGAGDPAWKASVISALRSEKFDSWYQEQSELYTVEVDEDLLKTIEG